MESEVPGLARLRLRAGLLEAIGRLAPELDVAALAPDRPVRAQVDLDSMDWLNLADAIGDAVGRPLPPQALAPEATIDSLVAALESAPSAPATGDAEVHRAPDGRSCRLRPLREEDALLDAEFVRRLSSDSRYQRFMTSMREMPASKLASLTHIDQQHHLAIVATTAGQGAETLVGVARSIEEPSGGAAEFAIVVADDWQGSGLAGALMRALTTAARAHGVRELYGIVLATNRRMIAFTRRLGFEAHPDPEDRRLVRVQRRLRS